MFEAVIAVKTIAALRVAVVLAWGLIGAWGLGALARVVFGHTHRGDYFWSSMAMLSFGLLIFQFRSLAGLAKPQTDYWTFAGLISLVLSAVGIFVTRALSAPDEHKRAALISHLVVMVMILTAGALS